MKKITLKDWKTGRAPKGTIYTGIKQPYLRTKNGDRYDITDGLAQEITRRRKEIFS